MVRCRSAKPCNSRFKPERRLQGDNMSLNEREPLIDAFIAEGMTLEEAQAAVTEMLKEL